MENEYPLIPKEDIQIDVTYTPGYGGGYVSFDFGKGTATITVVSDYGGAASLRMADSDFFHILNRLSVMVK